MNEMTTTTAHATAKRGEDGGIVVADPFREGEYHADAQSLIKSVHDKQHELRAAFDALGELDAAPSEAVSEMYKSLKDADKRLCDYTGDMIESLLLMSGFKAVVTQIKGTGTRLDPMSVRGKIKDMKKACEARLDAENTNKESVVTYAIQVTCTDKMRRQIVAHAKKIGACDVYCAAPKTDKATKQIVEWFKANLLNTF